MNLSNTIYDEITHNCIVKIYPDGRKTVLCSEKKLFRERGWELSDDWGGAADAAETLEAETAAPCESAAADSILRSRRRARSAVRDLAYSNDFDMFVTFTLDERKIDRYDVVEITKMLNSWLDNRVRRNGLKYVLVPELHKDGAVHFHGLISAAALTPEDSGTLTNGGKPRKPRSAAQRHEWLENGWHIVYNLPEWTLGFSTGLYLYGDHDAAVSYVLKYIAKSEAKIGGRWYYHGGALALPSVLCVDLDFDDLAAQYPLGVWRSSDSGLKFITATVEGGC